MEIQVNGRAGMARIADRDVLADIELEIAAAVVSTRPPSMAGAQVIPCTMSVTRYSLPNYEFRIVMPARLRHYPDACRQS
jgi:hypothetical protein